MTGSPLPWQSTYFDGLFTRIVHTAFVNSLWFGREYMHVKKILGTFTCFRCVHLRLSGAADFLQHDEALRGALSVWYKEVNAPHAV